jgi:hypothetical protein
MRNNERLLVLSQSEDRRAGGHLRMWWRLALKLCKVFMERVLVSRDNNVEVQIRSQ